MKKYIFVQRITNASLAFLISTSFVVSAAEEGDDKTEKKESAFARLAEGLEYTPEELEELKKSEELKAQIHAEVQKVLRQFQENMNGYYQRMGNSKRIAWVLDEDLKPEMGGENLDSTSSPEKPSMGGSPSNTTAGFMASTTGKEGEAYEGGQKFEDEEEIKKTESEIAVEKDAAETEDGGKSEDSKKKGKKEAEDGEEKADDEGTHTFESAKVLTLEELEEIFKARWNNQDVSKAEKYYYSLYEITEITTANVENVIDKIDCIRIFQENNIKNQPSMDDIARYSACLYAILCRGSNRLSEDSLLKFDHFMKRAIAEYVIAKGNNLKDCTNIGILKIDDFKDMSITGWFSKDVAAKTSSFTSPPPSPIKKTNNATNTASPKTLSTQSSEKKDFKDLELYKQGKVIRFSEDYLNGQNIIVIIFDGIKEIGGKTFVQGAHLYTYNK